MIIPSTKLTIIPTTIPKTIQTTIPKIEPTTIPKVILTSIITTLPNIKLTTTIPEIKETIYEDKCLNGTEINVQCRNLTNEEIYSKLKDEILDSYISNKLNSEYNGDNYALKVSTSASEKLLNFNNSKIPVIDLGDCEKNLKEFYNIPFDSSLIIIKLEEKSSDIKSKNFQFDVFNPITYEKLDISICQNDTIDLYVPLLISEEKKEKYDNILNQGYNPFDLNDKFYREICTPYSSENGTDVLLDEREEFVYSSVVNETICPENCDYSTYSLDNKYIKCECEVNSTYITLDAKHISGENIYLSFLSALKSSNYKVMICYNLVFNFKIFCHNYGSILSLLCFIAYIIFMIYYSYKEISPLKVEISKLIFIETEKEKETQLEKKVSKYQEGKIDIKRSIKNKNKKQYPPKKEKSRRLNSVISGEVVNNTEDIELKEKNKTKVKKLKKKDKKTTRRLSKMGMALNLNEYQIKDIQPNDYESENNKDDIIINDKKNEKKNLDDFELNELDYDEACDLDKRSFCRTYWSVLKREHLILFTFFVKSDYNLFYVKLERFFILICTQFTMNGMFFIHESMHRKYVQQEEFTFVQKLPQLLFTLIAAHIIEVILCFLSMTDVHIYQIKALPMEQKKGEEVLDIIDKMKTKLSIFFIFTFLLFLFYWYFISAFCAVYQNTQIIFLRDSGLSILTSFLDPFIIYGITTLLRIISLSLCFKNKFGCLYKLSGFIPIF